MPPLRRSATLVAALSLVLPRPARAADPDAEVSARLSFVVAALERDEPRSRQWQAAWIFTFGGLSVSQATLAIAASNPDVRAASIAGALKSGLGFVARLASPITAAGAATRLHGMPEATPAERRAKLRLAESLLRSSHDEQRFNCSWMPLVAGVAINLAGAAVLWGGYHRAGAGWFGLTAGIGVTQLQYWTQPTGSLTAWKAYTAALARGALPVAPPRAALAVSWSLAPSPGGMALRASF